MAELGPDEKDAISHRGRAARTLARRLGELESERRPPGLVEGLLGGQGSRRA